MAGKPDELGHRRTIECGIRMEGPGAVWGDVVAVASGLLLRTESFRRGFSVEARAIQITLGRILRRSDVVEPLLFGVDREFLDHIVWSCSDEARHPIGSFDFVGVTPSVALAEPQEAFSFVDPIEGIDYIHPCGVRVFKERAGRARTRVRENDIVRVLQTVELLEHEFL